MRLCTAHFCWEEECSSSKNASSHGRRSLSKAMTLWHAFQKRGGQIMFNCLCGSSETGGHKILVLQNQGGRWNPCRDFLLALPIYGHICGLPKVINWSPLCCNLPQNRTKRSKIEERTSQELRNAAQVTLWLSVTNPLAYAQKLSGR